MSTAAGAVRQVQRLRALAGGARRGAEAAREALAPLTERLAPVLGTASAFAWSLLGVGVLAAVAGVLLDWRELVLLAVLVAAVLVLAAPFMIGRSAYSVDLGLAATRVVAGERAVGRVEVRNASARSLLPARIELPVGSAVAVFPLPRLAPGALHDELFTIPTARRGVITVGPLRSVRGDGLGLFRRIVAHTAPEDLYVHPRTVVVGGSSSGLVKDLEGRPVRELSNNDVSFHALRGYTPGDDRRYVHWKTTARTGSLMVRQFEETRRSHLAVGLSLDPGEYGDDEQFELAVSSCGSLALQALREGQELSVVVQGRALRARGGKTLLDDLAGVDPVERAADVVGLARTVAAAAPQASVVILVVGALASPARLRAAAEQLPAGARALVVRCDAEALAGRRSIGELVLHTVAQLDDLPRAMRRAS